jgi:hypothetical protein
VKIPLAKSLIRGVSRLFAPHGVFTVADFPSFDNARVLHPRLRGNRLSAWPPILKIIAQLLVRSLGQWLGQPERLQMRPHDGECLDHVIAFDEGLLRRTLNSYFDHYHRSRTHLPLGKDSPESRAIQPPEMVVAVPRVGGLHHRYERRAA